MNTTIEIVDRGRGPQLSTSRITVQDLLPFYRDGASHEEIRRWIPSLSDEEIRLSEEYIRGNYDEVWRAEERIKAFHDRMRAGQPGWARTTDDLPLEERRSLLRALITSRGPGDCTSLDCRVLVAATPKA